MKQLEDLKAKMMTNHCHHLTMRERQLEANKGRPLTQYDLDMMEYNAMLDEEFGVVPTLDKEANDPYDRYSLEEVEHACLEVAFTVEVEDVISTPQNDEHKIMNKLRKENEVSIFEASYREAQFKIWNDKTQTPEEPKTNILVPPEDTEGQIEFYNENPDYHLDLYNKRLQEEIEQLNLEEIFTAKVADVISKPTPNQNE